MKVILNVDVKHLGEEGDIKTVARGYARNYLFPRDLAVPYNEITLAHFEARREEIEERKAAKRKDAASLKERIEALEIKISMPAGPNGKLYGAVTSHTLMEELQKAGFEIERKKIEIAGSAGSVVKSVGTHTASIKLYENASADLKFTVEAQITEEKTEKKEKRSKHREERAEVKEEAAEENAEEKKETEE